MLDVHRDALPPPNLSSLSSYLNFLDMAYPIPRYHDSLPSAPVPSAHPSGLHLPQSPPAPTFDSPTNSPRNLDVDADVEPATPPDGPLIATPSLPALSPTISRHIRTRSDPSLSDRGKVASAPHRRKQIRPNSANDSGEDREASIGGGGGGGNNGGGKAKRFACKYPGCDRSFARAYNLNTHYACHINFRPWPCHLCPKNFSRRHDLGRHLGAVHNSKDDSSADNCFINGIPNGHGNANATAIPGQGFEFELELSPRGSVSSLVTHRDGPASASASSIIDDVARGSASPALGSEHSHDHERENEHGSVSPAVSMTGSGSGSGMFGASPVVPQQSRAAQVVPTVPQLPTMMHHYPAWSLPQHHHHHQQYQHVQQQPMFPVAGQLYNPISMSVMPYSPYVPAPNQHHQVPVQQVHQQPQQQMMYYDIEYDPAAYGNGAGVGPGQGYGRG